MKQMEEWKKGKMEECSACAHNQHFLRIPKILYRIQIKIPQTRILNFSVNRDISYSTICH